LPAQRLVREREEALRETSLGTVRVKVVREGARVVRVSPEFEECRRLAMALQRPLVEISRLLARELADG
jgi:uncharacterized protein (DUF111 family)